MKRRTGEILTAIILGAVVPAVFFRIAQHCVVREQENAVTQPTYQQPDAETDSLLPVLMENGEIRMMVMDDYVTAVVLAEMPTDFETEALKAQAVVARTYALRRVTTGNKHPQQAVCTDSACCQAYCADPEHTFSAQTVEKIRGAVRQTQGQVLTYGGSLIEATYFSCSGGMTEDAAAVWGEDIPYLQSVESPGEEGAAHYVDTVSFSASEFSDKLGKELSGQPGEWIGPITYTEGGGVDTICIGGEQYSGTQLRSLLGLRSTAFLITGAGDTVTVTTKGFGHRVGMSQYGADAMAVRGSTYEEILAHYYPGTVLEKWPDN